MLLAGFTARCVECAPQGGRGGGRGEREGMGERVRRDGEVMSGQVFVEYLQCLVLFANSLLLSLE